MIWLPIKVTFSERNKRAKTGDWTIWGTQPEGFMMPLFGNSDTPKMQERAKQISDAVNAFPGMVAALQSAEEALEEGHEACGGGDDNVYAEPLAKVQAALTAAGAKTLADKRKENGVTS